MTKSDLTIITETLHACEFEFGDKFKNYDDLYTLNAISYSYVNKQMRFILEKDNKEWRDHVTLEQLRSDYEYLGGTK